MTYSSCTSHGETNDRFRETPNQSNKPFSPRTSATIPSRGWYLQDDQSKSPISLTYPIRVDLEMWAEQHLCPYRAPFKRQGSVENAYLTSACFNYLV